jgi:cell division protein ZapA (FtsZ GTPase activity inhibitor)
MNKVTYSVKIGDETYNVVTDEQESIFLAAAQLLDSLVKDMQAAGLNDRKKSAIMAALYIATQLMTEKNKVLDKERELRVVESWLIQQEKRLVEV